jgi:hypothetical protein
MQRLRRLVSLNGSMTACNVTHTSDHARQFFGHIRSKLTLPWPAPANASGDTWTDAQALTYAFT